MRSQAIFIKNIISIRNMLNLTQPEFAKEVGISKAYLFQLENGQSVPTLTILDKIAKRVNMEGWQLLKEFRK